MTRQCSIVDACGSVKLVGLEAVSALRDLLSCAVSTMFIAREAYTVDDKGVLRVALGCARRLVHPHEAFVARYTVVRVRPLAFFTHWVAPDACLLIRHRVEPLIFTACNALVQRLRVKKPRNASSAVAIRPAEAGRARRIARLTLFECLVEVLSRRALFLFGYR